MAACVQCGASLPRGAGACPNCGTPAPRPAKRAAAKAGAKPAAEPPAEPAARPPSTVAAKAAAKPPAQASGRAIARPVVKAVAAPVTPSVKSGDAPLVPTPKAAPKPAPRAAGRSAAKPAAKAAAKPAAKRVATSDGAPSRRRTAAKQAAVSPFAPGYEPPPQPPGETVAAPAAPAPPVSPDVVQPAPPAAPLAARRPATSDVLGDADERDPHDPVVPVPPPPPGVFAELFEESPADGRRPFPLRVVRGDWRPALLTALPALVATLVLAALAVVALVSVDRPGGDEALAGEPSAGRWVRYVCATVGMLFGSPLTVEAEMATGPGEDLGYVPDDFAIGYALRFVPLTLTLLALAALWLAARWAARRTITPDRAADAFRAALVYAGGVAAVTAGARWSLTGSELPFFGDLGGGIGFDVAFSSSPWKALFWAFCGAFAVVWLATGRVVAAGRWARWALATRGAVVGLAAGVAASFTLLVAFAYVYASEVDADTADVTTAVPVAGGFGIDLGTAAFGVFSGGQFVFPFGERQRWSLLSPWVPKPYLLLLVVPALAVLLGALYIARRGGAPAPEAARASALMGAPAGFLWLALAIAGSARMHQTSTFGFAGDTAAGAVLWDALLVGLWFGAGGWLAGRLLARRSAPVDQPEQAPVP